MKARRRQSSGGRCREKSGISSSSISPSTAGGTSSGVSRSRWRNLGSPRSRNPDRHRVERSGGRADGDRSARWHHGDGRGVDCQEEHHRVGGRAGMPVELGQLDHGLEPERGRGVAETEHVGGHVHHHRAHRGMVGGHIGKEAPQERRQPAGDCVAPPAVERHAHDAEHEDHDTDELDHEFDGGERTVDDREVHGLHLAAERGVHNGCEDETEPDRVEHRTPPVQELWHARCRAIAAGEAPG